MAQKSRVQAVLRNAAFVTVGSGVSRVLLGVTGLFLIRYLGLTLYSEYSTAMLFMGIFSVLGFLGLNRVLLRDCSRDVALTPDYFGAALLLNGTFVFTGYLVALTISFFRFDSRIFTLTIVLGLSQLLMCLQRMSTTVFQVHQRQHFTAMVTFSAAMLYAIAVFTAIALKASVFLLAGLHMAMNLVAIVLSCIFSFRLSFPRLDLTVAKKMLLIGRQFFAIDIVLAIYARTNGFILAALNLGEQVGIFSAAFRLFSLIDMMAVAVNTSISPAVYAASKEPELMIRGVKLVARYYMVSGFFVGAVLLGRAEWLMTTLFKTEFAQSANILKLMAVVMASRFILNPLSNVIFAMNKERFILITLTGVAAFTVVAGLILIPLYGAIGAACVFLAGELIMVVLWLTKSEGLFSGLGLWKLLALPFFSALLTLVFFILSHNWPILGLVLSPMVFYGFLFLTGYYHVSEAKHLAKVFIKSQ